MGAPQSRDLVCITRAIAATKSLSVAIGDSKVEPVGSIKVLGLNFNRKLKSDHHNRAVTLASTAIVGTSGWILIHLAATRQSGRGARQGIPIPGVKSGLLLSCSYFFLPPVLWPLVYHPHKLTDKVEWCGKSNARGSRVPHCNPRFTNT